MCRIFASGHVPGSFKKAKNKSMQWRSGTDKTFAHRRKGWPSAPFLPVIARSVRRYVKPTFASNFSIQLSRDFIQNHSPTRRINFAKKLYNAGGGNRFFNPHWRTAPPAEKEVPGKTQPPRPLFTYDGNAALTLDKFLRKGREVERKVILTRIRKARLNQPRLRLHILSAAILFLMFVIFVIPDVSIFRNKQ